MIVYHEASERNLEFFYDENYPILTEKDKREIETHWQNACRKNPTGLFNGQIYSCNTFEDDGRTLQIGVNKTDYKTYKWARDNKKPIRGAYAMGNGMIVFDQDRQAYVMLQRSNTVGFDQGKVSSMGGVLDYADLNMGNFIDYVEQATSNEVDEEVYLAGNLTAVGLLGLYWDSNTYKVEFGYLGIGKVLGVKANENKALLEIPKNKLADFTRHNQSRIEASTLVHLNQFAARLS